MSLNADIAFFEKEWEHLTFDINQEVSKHWFSFIVAKYSEKHRFYHNLVHVQSLLELAEKHKTYLNNINAVQWAVWFHDVIYDPQSKENELESNKVWLQFVQEAKSIDKNIVNLVQAMIIGSSKHNIDLVPKELLKENDKDILYFFDFDLSILSTESSVYEKYAEAIRKEYAYVPDTLYKEGRTKVLESFLSRQIYCSPPFKLLELKAKQNLKQELLKLKNN